MDNTKKTTRQTACLAVLAAALAAGALPAATTFDALQRELAEAADGATVYVENDIVYTAPLVQGLAARVTLASPPGQTNTLMRAASYAEGAFLTLADAAADLTLANLVVDGNRAAGRQRARFIDLTAGRLTLEAGAELRNVEQAPEGSIRVLDAGELVMNEGAALRGFVNAKWGTGVLVGIVDAGDTHRKGRFTMNGGLITGCASTYADGGAPGAYGGAVYVWSGTFDMRGGLVTGNTAKRACAGVAAYKGDFLLSGAASVTNNAGDVINDIAYWGNDAYGYLYVAGPWTGRATVYAPRVESAGTSDRLWACFVAPHARFTPGKDDMPGLGNLSVQGRPDLVADGYVRTCYTDTKLALADTQLSVHFKPCAARLGERLAVASPRELLDQLTDGDDVEICRDLELPRTLAVSNGWTLTVRSDANGPWTLARPLSGLSSPFAIVSNGTLRLARVVVDGQGLGRTPQQATLLRVLAGGDATLADGAVLQNGMRGEQCPAVYVAGSGARFTMEPGSVVRNFSTTNAASWATAMRIGEYEAAGRPAADPRPVFTMNGGTISNCVSGTTQPASGGYGGAVYVQNARFDFNGGLITANAAPHGGCAGVMAYIGSVVTIGGTATATNNPGPHPDLFRCGGTLRMAGAFRGRVGVSSGSQTPDGPLDIACAEGATGAWNFFSAGTEPYGALVGYMWRENRAVYLGAADGWLDGTGLVCAYEDFAHFTPTAIDVDAEAGALPHVFGGRAAAAGGALDVIFDEAAARAAGRTDIPLLAAREGDALTGAWTFRVPKAARGVWKVKPVRTARGVVAWHLVWLPTGTVFVIR